MEVFPQFCQTVWLQECSDKVSMLDRGCKLAEVLEISCGVNMHPDKHIEAEVVFQKLKGL